MLNRLTRDVWDLDSFIIEVQNRYPDKFSKEAIEAIFNSLQDNLGYCCIEDLCEEFEEWTFENFINYIKNAKYYVDYYSTENINQALWVLYGDDGNDDIVRVLYENETIVVTQYFDG